jgi:hypothetical protein
MANPSMTEFPHDRFAKNLLESLLAPGGQVTTALTIDSEVREIDVYFNPTNDPKSSTTSQERIKSLSLERLEDLIG